MKANVRRDPVRSALIETNKFNEKESIIFWITMSFIVGFLFIAPFIGSGLFNGNVEQFETPIYGAVLWSSIFLLILSIYYWGYWRLRTVRDILSIAIWAIPFSYLISLIPAASHQYSSNMLLISIIYAIFFLLGSFAAQGKLSAAITQFTIVLSGYFIVIIGLLNLFGNTFYKDAVMFDQGLRLTSLFQYANAYAGFLIALLFSGLYLVVSTRKWYYVLAHSLMIVPILSSFWLTQSRGALVLLPIILVLILPFVSLLRQIQMVVYVAAAAIISITLTNKFVAIGTAINTANGNEYIKTGKVTSLLSPFNSTSFAGWSRLLLASLLFAGVVTLIRKYLIPLIEAKFAQRTAKKYLTLIFPIGIVLCGVIGAVLLLGDTGFTKILPDILRTRLESINFQQHSVLERGTFYKDAVKLVKEYPVFGAGGGGWASLYERYQNNPYTSRQTHNFLLQYLVEVGIFGLLLLLGILGAIFFYYFKYFFNKPREGNDGHLIFYIIALSLFVHSLLDFDMSYVYLAAVVFLCLGGMASSVPYTDIKWKKAVQIEQWRWVFPALISIIGITVLIVSAVNYHADKLFNTAQYDLQTGKPYDQITASLDSALSLKPNHPDFVLTKINLMLQGYDQLKDESFYTKAVSLTEGLKKTEPYNRDVLEYEYKLALLKQKKDEALKIINAGLLNFPWQIQLYERAIDLNYQLGEKNWPTALEVYNKVLAQDKHLLTLPKGQAQGNPFSVTPAIRSTVGQIYYSQKNYPAAIDLLKAGLTEKLDKPTDRTIARFYIASLHKTKQNDEAVYNKLIAIDPNEKANVEKLVSQ